MKTVALISGGKDSCFNMMCCVAEGHTLTALANLRPQNKDELDSYMFQTVGHHAIDLYAEALGLPLYTQVIQGSSLSTGKDYAPQDGDEVEDLYVLLSKIKESEDIEAVSVGAILSDYQRVRVENVCQRLGLVALSYLWRRNQEELLKEMIDCGVKAIIIKVAALGLLPDKHLGMELSEILPHMLQMKSKYGLNECGEGGEYETFVFDCPLFKKTIVIENTEKVIHSDDAFAPVGYLNLKHCHLQDKNIDSLQLVDRICELPLLTSKKWISAQIEDATLKSESFQQLPNVEDGLHVSASHKSHTNEQNDLSCGSDGVFFQVSGIRAPSDLEKIDVKVAAMKAMDALRDCVQGLGHRVEDITSVSLYLKDLASFADINSVYKTYFGRNPPVRLCVQVCLPRNVPLQIDCQGWAEKLCIERNISDTTRSTLHVQALSHWAPANIGPYSQATQMGHHVYMAGIVPLVPATLNVVEGDISVQCALGLRHVQEVMSAMCADLTPANCPLVMCYVTSPSHISVAQQVWMQCIEKVSESHILPEKWPRVQCCVVPALPKSCLVEWQLCSWIQTRGYEGNDLDIVDIPKRVMTNKNWTIELDYLFSKKESRLFSCHIQVDLMVPETEMNTADIELCVKDMLGQYLLAYQNMRRQLDDQLAGSGTVSPPLVKLLFVARLLDYDFLHNLVTSNLSESCISQPPVVSLVPVAGLESSCQIMAWCQL